MEPIHEGDTLFEKDGKGYTVLINESKSVYSKERLKESDEGEKKFKKKSLVI